MSYISIVYGFILVLSVSIHNIFCNEPSKDLKGHLKPIFSYGERLSTEVFRGFPHPDVFFRDYVSRERPVLLQEAAKTFPAFEKWSDDYFVSLPQSKKLVVTVETKKKEDRLQPTDDLSFSAFIKHYHNKDIYMVETIPEFLRKDVLIPSCIACQSITNGNMLQAMMWISSGGTQSVLHNDYAENINCVFKGSKTFYIVDRKYMEMLNVTELGYSDVDVDRVDLNKYPGLYDMEHYKVTVQAGDCLYIPFLWVHQVSSDNQNMAVNFWWKNKVKVNYETCGIGKITVDDVTFSGFDSLHEAQYKMIKGRLRHRIRTKGPMTFDDLLGVIADVTDIHEEDVNVDENIKEAAKKIFLMVDSFPTDGMITLEDVDNLTDENLKVMRKHLTSILESMQRKEHEIAGGEMSGENVDKMPPQGVESNANERPEIVEKEMKQDGRQEKKFQLNEEMQWKQMVENRRDRREL